MAQQVQQSSSNSLYEELDEADDPRRVFARVQKEIENYRSRGKPIPVDLDRLHRQLVAECAALSQGR